MGECFILLGDNMLMITCCDVGTCGSCYLVEVMNRL